MELGKSKQEIKLQGGDEMEAVSICCDAFVRGRRSLRHPFSSYSLGQQDIESLEQLSLDAAIANFTPPDTTSSKELLLSANETLLAVTAARQLQPSKKLRSVLPPSTMAAISAIAAAEINLTR